jgi:cytochrome oxidase assembly protein ShyY1
VLRFMTSRQWVMRIVAGLVLATACVLLGLWQLDRNEQRQARNAAVQAGLNQDPVPIDDALAVGRPVDDAEQWRAVRVHGEFDANQLVLRLRPQGGQAGVHVVTPLITDSGAAVLVDRGFVATSGTQVPDLPPPPLGPVDLVGRVRAGEDGGDRTGDPASGMVRYVDLDVLSAALEYPLYGGWLELVDQDPPADESLALVPPPELESGPHLSYALQWFAFAVIGVGGFVFLVRAESRARREESAADGTSGVAIGETTRTRTR